MILSRSSLPRTSRVVLLSFPLFCSRRSVTAILTLLGGSLMPPLPPTQSTAMWWHLSWPFVVLHCLSVGSVLTVAFVVILEYVRCLDAFCLPLAFVCFGLRYGYSMLLIFFCLVWNMARVFLSFPPGFVV